MEVVKLNRRKSQVKLPKLGWVKFRASRHLDGETIRSATLSREGRHWFVSLLVEDGKTTPASHAAPEAKIGVDRGVAVAVATSAGDLLDQVFTTAAEQRRALRLQRKLSRAARGSANPSRSFLAEILAPAPLAGPQTRGSRASTYPTRRAALRRKRPVRAKRFSGAPTARVPPSTRM